MSVSTQHPAYIAAQKRWKLIRAIVNNDAQCYLRSPDANDVVRTKQYKDDALLRNFTNLTRIGLAGLIFKKEPEYNLPAELEYLEDNFTGSGINMTQAAQSAASEMLQTGRVGFLVDFYNDGKQAYVKPYDAESIINWKEKVVNGVSIPWLVVLEEKVLDERNDLFSQDMIVQYRVLVLDEIGQYHQQVYGESGDIESDLLVLDANGRAFDFLPFIFAGSENNDSRVDGQPLFDLARIDLQIYRNSADEEESGWMCGQPHIHLDIGETDEETFNANNPNGVAFGTRKMTITQKGNMTLVQSNPNTMIGTMIEKKLEQAAAIGARLIAPAGGRETAEAARIRYGAQNSALFTLTSNLSWAFERCIEVVCRFMGVNPNDVEFELNHQFYDETADPNLIAQQIMLLDRGVIAVDDIRAYGRKTGFIDPERSNEDLELEAEKVDPLEGANVKQTNIAASAQTPVASDEAG